jgi:hypothetical protein
MGVERLRLPSVPRYSDEVIIYTYTPKRSVPIPMKTVSCSGGLAVGR